MKNLTPEHMRCNTISCPAVYELGDDKLLIVGKKAALMAAYEQIPCGLHETAIVIDRALLANLVEHDFPTLDV